MKQRWIKASELGEFLYCQRAWWYWLQGMASANAQELAHGTAEHVHHGRGLRVASWQRVLAFLLIAAAVVMVIFQLK